MEFLQFKTVALKFTSKNIYIYNYKEHTQMYYKTTISDGQKLNIISTPIPAVEGWGLIQINGLEVMFSLEEVENAKAMVTKAKQSLKNDKIAFSDNIPIGVMIETPAAVMISGELAREVDFFSIGTNDLTQLTLGVDRKNGKVDKYFNPHHPALLKMIRIVANNVHLEGKHISICGDLAADLSMTEFFIQIGIDELSVAPSQVLALRKKIREIQ